MRQLPHVQESIGDRTFLRSPVRLDYPDVPIWAILAGAKRRWPESLALQSDDESLTWHELWARSTEVAASFRTAGLAPGSVVAAQLPNSVELAVTYWASQLAGLTFTPVNPFLPAKDMARQLADSGARLVRPTTAGGRLDEFAPHQPADLGTAIAHISYTGGTTGTPKGVLVSQRNVVRNAMQFCYWATGSVPSVDPDGGVVLDQVGDAAQWPIRLGHGVAIATAPWFHAMGLIGGVVVPALQGTRSLLIGRFDPERYLDTVQRERVTSVSGAPALLAALVKTQLVAPRDTRSVRWVSCGGGPLSPALAERLESAFPNAVVTQAYGLTEVTMAAVGCPTGRHQTRHRGTVGVPLPDTEVRLVPPGDPRDGADDGSGGGAGGPGQGGEILLRGPQVMVGYHNRPEETAAVLHDGWLRTGDVGVATEAGELVIVDRAKDMLIYKGYNVYPSELEALVRAYPGVRDAAVVGVPDPDAGDLPVAFVVPDGARALDTHAIAAHVNEQVVHYKKLRAVYLIDALPTSPVGKVLKGPLRARAVSLQHGGDVA